MKTIIIFLILASTCIAQVDYYGVIARKNAYGPELVTNGDFTAWTGDNPDDWTVSGEVTTDPEVSEVGTGESHGDAGTGSCNLFTSGDNTNFNQGLATVIGETYRLTFDISYITGSIQVKQSAALDFNESFTTTGTKEIIFVCQTQDLTMTIKRNNACDATFDNFSVREIL